MFPTSKTSRKPRGFGRIQGERKPRNTTIFKWWNRARGRIWVIAGQMSWMEHNQDPRSHAQFFGEGPNSLAWLLLEKMSKYDPLEFKALMSTCSNEKQFEQGVRKIYMRIWHCGNDERARGSKNEHYATRHNPATNEEIAEARRLMVHIGH